MDQRVLNCAVCGKPMQQLVVENNVKIDCCDAHGIWLDVGEMESIISQAKTKAQPLRQSGGALSGVGSTFAHAAAGGAGFGVGSEVARSLIRMMFNR